MPRFDPAEAPSEYPAPYCVVGVDDDGNGYVDDWIGYDFIDGVSNCWSGEDCNTQDNDPRDFNGHGTHVASTIGAPVNNIGIAGVAPNATLVGLKACTVAGYCFADSVAALQRMDRQVPSGPGAILKSKLPPLDTISTRR